MCGLHGEGFLFAVLTAGFGADRPECDQTGGVEEPSGQDHLAGQGARLAGQEQEHGLGDVIGEAGIGDLTSCSGVDQSDVSLHQFGEGVLGSGGVFLKKFPVFHGNQLVSGSHARQGR